MKAFTDDPKKDGTLTPDGSGTYEYRPDPESNGIESILDKPIADPEFDRYITPNYTHRDEFEKHVIDTIGVNPFMINPSDAIKEADNQLPELFNHIFQGKVIWDDRNKLDSKQMSYWNDTVKRFHADMYNKALDHKQQVTEQYNFMMNQFDNQAREYNARMEMFKKDLEKYTPKPKKPVVPTREDIIAISKFENGLLYGDNSVVDPDTGQIPSNFLRDINRARESVV